MVRHLGNLAGAAVALFRPADWSCRRHHRRGSDAFALPGGADGGRTVCHAAPFGSSSWYWRIAAVLYLGANQLRNCLCTVVAVLALLHADNGSDQFAVVPANEGSQPGLRRHSRVGNVGMDCRRAVHWVPKTRGHGHANATGGRLLLINGGLLLELAAHSTPGKIYWLESENAFSRRL